MTKQGRPRRRPGELALDVAPARKLRRAAIAQKPAGGLKVPAPAKTAPAAKSGRIRGKSVPAPKKPSWPQPLECGVYFGLPPELHHADPAIGSGDLKNLLKGPAEYWFDSVNNPDRPRYETDAMAFGTAMHKLTLEGVPAFHATYVKGPEAADLLDTREDIVRRLAELGDGDPPRLKSDCALRLLELDPDAQIKSVIEEAAARAGKVILPHDTYARIVQGALLIARDEQYHEAFTGGEPEVTVIYVRPDGVRCKARFDYLKPRAIVDLKTIGNTRGMAFKRAILTSFWNYRRDLQAEHYSEARRHLPELVRRGQVFGRVDKAWLKSVAEQEAFAFVLIYFQSAGAPIHYGMKLSPGNPILRIARDHIDAAIDDYKRFMAEFGPSKMWLAHEPLAELDIDELPAWSYR